VTLVTLPRLDRATQGSAWFAALAAAAVTIAVQPLERSDLPRWIAARLARQKQKAGRDVLDYLAEQCEGNLLAARQEIEKLALLLPEGELDLAAVEAATADVARYDVFQLSEAWLAGDATRLLRILAVLRAEGEPVTLAVWQLAEDLHALARVQSEARDGTSLATALRNARVWGKRQAAMERAARRVTAGRARHHDDRRRAVGRPVQGPRPRRPMGRSRRAGADAGGHAGAPARRSVA
jgi:DNA polymerase-3 subunit delta